MRKFIGVARLWSKLLNHYFGKYATLDTGVLALATYPSSKEKQAECKKWFADRLDSGDRYVIPEIADWELRRKLSHMQFVATLRRLDELKDTIRYLPIITPAMQTAAEFWADVGWRDLPTAPDPRVDGDVILAAQAVVLAEETSSALVVTDKLGHLSRFVTARRWEDNV